ncbi:MAG: hypothetical protein AAF996_02395 [Pseudomonadota bacterium]
MSNSNVAALDRAWPIICQLISLLQVHVPGLTPQSQARWRWSHLMRVAESMVRRWLMLKACQDALPYVSMQVTHGGDRPRPDGLRNSDSAPLFRLVEREAPFPFWVYEPATATAPAQWVLVQSVGGGQPLGISTAFNPENLKRRCIALSHVMENPAVHTLRMARWLARATARRKVEAGRAHPLRVGWPPGASHQQKRRDPERQDMLTWLDRLAREALPP